MHTYIHTYIQCSEYKTKRMQKIGIICKVALSHRNISLVGVVVVVVAVLVVLVVVVLVDHVHSFNRDSLNFHVGNV